MQAQRDLGGGTTDVQTFGNGQLSRSVQVGKNGQPTLEYELRVKKQSAPALGPVKSMGEPAGIVEKALKGIPGVDASGDEVYTVGGLVSYEKGALVQATGADGSKKVFFIDISAKEKAAKTTAYATDTDLIEVNDATFKNDSRIRNTIRDFAASQTVDLNELKKMGVFKDDSTSYEWTDASLFAEGEYRDREGTTTGGSGSKRLEDMGLSVNDQGEVKGVNTFLNAQKFTEKLESGKLGEAELAYKKAMFDFAGDAKNTEKIFSHFKSTGQMFTGVVDDATRVGDGIAAGGVAVSIAALPFSGGASGGSLVVSLGYLTASTALSIVGAEMVAVGLNKKDITWGEAATTVTFAVAAPLALAKAGKVLQEGTTLIKGFNGVSALSKEGSFAASFMKTAILPSEAMLTATKSVSTFGKAIGSSLMTSQGMFVLQNSASMAFNGRAMTVSEGATSYATSIAFAGGMSLIGRSAQVFKAAEETGKLTMAARVGNSVVSGVGTAGVATAGTKVWNVMVNNESWSSGWGDKYAAQFLTSAVAFSGAQFASSFKVAEIAKDAGMWTKIGNGVLSGVQSAASNAAMFAAQDIVVKNATDPLMNGKGFGGALWENTKAAGHGALTGAVFGAAFSAAGGIAQGLKGRFASSAEVASAEKAVSAWQKAGTLTVNAAKGAAAGVAVGYGFQTAMNLAQTHTLFGQTMDKNGNMIDNTASDFFSWETTGKFAALGAAGGMLAGSNNKFAQWMKGDRNFAEKSAAEVGFFKKAANAVASNGAFNTFVRGALAGTAAGVGNFAIDLATDKYDWSKQDAGKITASFLEGAVYGIMTNAMAGQFTKHMKQAGDTLAEYNSTAATATKGFGGALSFGERTGAQKLYLESLEGAIKWPLVSAGMETMAPAFQYVSDKVTNVAFFAAGVDTRLDAEGRFGASYDRMFGGDNWRSTMNNWLISSQHGRVLSPVIKTITYSGKVSDRAETATDDVINSRIKNATSKGRVSEVIGKINPVSKVQARLGSVSQGAAEYSAKTRVAAALGNEVLGLAGVSAMVTGTEALLQTVNASALVVDARMGNLSDRQKEALSEDYMGFMKDNYTSKGVGFSDEERGHLGWAVLSVKGHTEMDSGVESLGSREEQIEALRQIDVNGGQSGYLSAYHSAVDKTVEVLKNNNHGDLAKKLESNRDITAVKIELESKGSMSGAESAAIEKAYSLRNAENVVVSSMATGAVSFASKAEAQKVLAVGENAKMVTVHLADRMGKAREMALSRHALERSATPEGVSAKTMAAEYMLRESSGAQRQAYVQEWSKDQTTAQGQVAREYTTRAEKIEENTKRLGDLRKTKSETPADDVLRAAQQKALFAETQVLKAQHDFAGAPTVEKFAKVQKQAEASLAEKIFDVHMKGGAVEVVDGMVKSKADVAPQAGEGKATRTVFGMDATFVENNKALFSDVFKKGEVTGHDLLNGKVGIEQTLQNAVMERLAVRENGTEGFSKNREALVTGKKHVDELDNLGGADRLDAWFKEGCAAKPIVEKYVKMGLTKEHAVKVAERQVSEIINEVRLPELLERNGWKPANKEARDAILGAKGTEEIAVKMKDRDGIERTYRMAVGSKEFNRVRDAVFAQTASEIGFKKALGKVGSEEWSKELNTAREKSSGAVRILENRIRIREKGSSSSLSEIEKAELSVMKAKLALMKSELSHASLPVRESLRTAWEESSGPLARAKFKEALTNKEGGAEGFIEKLGFGTKEQIQAHEAVFGRVIERLVANKERVVDAMTSDSFKNLSSLKDIEIKAIKNELTKEISPQLYDKMSDKKRNELISLSDVISDKKSELKASTDNKQSESIQNEITAKENELRKIADDLSKELNVGAEFLAEVMPEISTALKKQRDATADAVNFEIIGQILRVVTLTGKNEGKGENRLEKIEVVDAATYASEMAKPEKDRTIKTSIVSETTKAEVHENLKTLLKEKAKIEGNPLKEQSIDTMVDATINKFVDTFNSTRETKSGSEYKMLTRTISEAIGEVKPTAPKAPEKKMPTDFKTQAEYDQYLAKDYPKAESAYKAEQAEYKKKLDVYNEKVKENAGKIKEAEDVDLAQIKTLVKEKLDRNVDAVDRMASALRLGIDFVQAEFGKTNYDRTNPQLQMLSGFLREKNVQLRAGGGKTIAFSLEMLVRDAGATNVQNQLLVAKTGEAYQTAMAGYEAVGGKGEVRLDFMARMFGKEIVDGKALKESGVENLAKALEDRNKIVVMDQESLGFSTLEESVALRKAYGNLDTVRWDEFHMPFSAPTSYISSKDANKAIDRTYIDQAIEVRKVMQELEAGGKLKDATVGLREGEIATDRVKESNDRKDGDGEALYIIDRKTNKYVYSDSFVELVKEKIGNRVNFNSKNDMMEAVNQYFQAEKLMDANSYSIHDGRIVPVGAGNLEVSRVFSSKEQIAALFAKEAAKGKLNVEADAAKQTVSTTGSSGSVAEVMRMINPAASNLGASGTIDTVELMVKMNIGKGVERASESVYDVSKTLGLQAEAGKTYVQQVIEQVVATIDAASEAGRGAIVLAKDQIMLDTIMSDPSVKKALERADKKGLKKAEIGIRSGEKDVGDIAANAKNHVIFANEKGATGIDYKGNIDLVLCDAHNWNISEIKQGIARNRRQEGTVGERAVLFDKSQMRMEERADGVVSKVMTKPRVDHIDSIIKEKVDAHTSHIERVAKGKEVSPETTRDKDDALALLRNAETLMAEDASAAIIFQTREAARSRGLIEPLKEMLRDPSLSASQKDAVQKIYEEVLNDNTGGSEMFVAHDAARGDQLMKQTVESVARQAADVFKRIADDPAKFGSSMAKRAEVYRTIAEDVATNYGTFVASSTAEGGYNSANSLRDVAKLSKSKELLDKIIIDDFSRTQTDRAVAQKTEALLVQQNSKTVRAEIADRAAEISRKNPKMDKNDAHQQAAQEVHAKQYELQHKVELCRQRVEVSNGSDGAAVAAYLNAMANALPQDSKLKEVLIGKDVGNGRSLLSIAEGYFSKGKEGGIATDARFMNVVMNLIEKNRSVTNVVGNTQQQKNKSFEDLEQEQSVAEFLLKAVAPNLTYASAHAGIVAYRNMPMAVKTELQKNPELMQEFLAKAPYVLAAITHDPANSADAYGLENASRHLSFSMLSFIEGQRDVLKGATFFDPLKAVGKAVALPSKQNADDMYGFEFAAMVDPDLDVLRYRALPKIRARLEQYIDLSKKFDRAELQTKKNDALIKVYQEEIKNKKRELRDAEDAAAKERITREIEQYEREVKRIGERKALAVNVVTKAKAGSAEVLGGLRTFKDAASFLRLAGKAQEHIDVNKIADMMDSDTFSEDMSQHLTKLNVPERELMMTMIDAVDPAAVSMFDKQKYADIAHVKNLIATDGAAQKSRFVRYDKEYVGDLAQKVVTAIAAVSGKSTLATINRALEKAYARSSYDDEEKAKIKKMTLRANGVEDESLLDDVEKLDAHLKQNVLRSFGLDALTPAASADDIKNALSFDALKKRVESLDGGASHETVMRTMMPYYQWEIERKIRKSAADKVKSMFGPSTDAYISQLKEAVKHAAMNKNSLAEQTGILARYDVAGVLKGRTTTLNEKEIDALLANKDLTVERMFVQSVEVVPPGALVNSETGKSVAAQVTADGVVKLDVGFLKFVTTKQSVGGEKKEVDRLVFDAATEYNFGEGAHELVHQFVKSFGTFIANDVGTSKPQQYEELKRLLSGTRDGRMYVRMIEETASIAAKNPWEIEYRINEMEENEMVVRGVSLVQTIEAMSRSSRMQHLDENMNAKYGAKSGAFFAHPEAALDMKGRSTDEIVRTAGGLSHEAIIRRMYTDEAVRRNWLVKASDPSVVRYNKQAAKDLRSVTDYLRSAPNAVELYFNGTKDQQSMQKVINNIFRENVRATAYDQDLLEKYNDLQKSTNQVDQKERLAQYLAALDRFGRALDSGTNRRVEHSDDGMPASVTIKNIGGTGRTGVGAGEGAGDADGAGKDFQNVSPETVMAYIGSIEALEAMATQVSQEADEKRGELLRKILAGMTENAVMETKDLRKMGDYVLAYEKSADMNAFARFVATAKNNLVATKEKAFVAMQQRLMKEQQKYADELTWLQNEQQQMQQKEQDLENQKPLIIVAAQNAAADIEARKAELAAVRAAYAGMTADDVAAVKQQLVAADVFPAELTSSIDRALGLGMKETAWTVLASEDAKALIDAAFTKKEAAIDAQGNASVQEAAKIDKRIAETQSRMAKNAEETTLAQASLTRAQEELKQLLESRKSDETKPSAAGSAVTASSAVELDPTRMTLSDLEQLLSDKVTKFGRLIGEIDAARAGYRNAGREVRLDKLAAISKAIDEFKVGAFRANEIIQVLAGSPMDEEHGDVRTNDDVLVNTIARSIVYGDTRELHLKRFDTANALSGFVLNDLLLDEQKGDASQRDLDQESEFNRLVMKSLREYQKRIANALVAVEAYSAVVDSLAIPQNATADDRSKAIEGFAFVIDQKGNRGEGSEERKYVNIPMMLKAYAEQTVREQFGSVDVLKEQDKDFSKSLSSISDMIATSTEQKGKGADVTTSVKAAVSQIVIARAVRRTVLTSVMQRNDKVAGTDRYLDLSNRSTRLALRKVMKTLVGDKGSLVDIKSLTKKTDVTQLMAQMHSEVVEQAKRFEEVDAAKEEALKKDVKESAVKVLLALGEGDLAKAAKNVGSCVRSFSQIVEINGLYFEMDWFIHYSFLATFAANKGEEPAKAVADDATKTAITLAQPLMQANPYVTFAQGSAAAGMPMYQTTMKVAEQSARVAMPMYQAMVAASQRSSAAMLPMSKAVTKSAMITAIPLMSAFDKYAEYHPSVLKKAVDDNAPIDQDAITLAPELKDWANAAEALALESIKAKQLARNGEVPQELVSKIKIVLDAKAREYVNKTGETVPLEAMEYVRANVYKKLRGENVATQSESIAQASMAAVTIKSIATLKRALDGKQTLPITEFTAQSATGPLSGVLGVIGLVNRFGGRKAPEKAPPPTKAQVGPMGAATPKKEFELASAG
jgi:predicted ester cyclase